MRLFVGLLPPPPVRDELILALEAHRPRWPGLRWLDPATWHVTLSFFGEVPEQVLPELRTRLADVAAHHAPMTLSLTGAGAFPSAGAARVFLTGLGATARSSPVWPTAWGPRRWVPEPGRRIAGGSRRT